jgi:hypothetical protein
MGGNGMKERFILFSTAMVRAILHGRKKQTRRVIKPQPDADGFIKSASTGHPQEWKFTKKVFNGVCNATTDWIKCPYGQPGDLLWVRETWGRYERVDGNILYLYRADAGDDPREYHVAGGWKPSIHMPKRAARIFLEITDVRVERVQDISEEDVLNEGFRMDSTEIIKFGYKGAFRYLWNSINAKRGYSWESDPWVWVIGFRRWEVE